MSVGGADQAEPSKLKYKEEKEMKDPMRAAKKSSSPPFIGSEI